MDFYNCLYLCSKILFQLKGIITNCWRVLESFSGILEAQVKKLASSKEFLCCSWRTTFFLGCMIINKILLVFEWDFCSNTTYLSQFYIDLQLEYASLNRNLSDMGAASNIIYFSGHKFSSAKILLDLYRNFDMLLRDSNTRLDIKILMLRGLH